MTPRRFWVTPQLVFGLAVAGLGVLFTLDNFGLLRARDVLRFWPAVLVAVGAAQIVEARTSARVVSGLIWTFVGGVLLANRLEFLRWDIWNFWPLAFVGVGGYIAWQAFVRPARPGPDNGAIVSGIAVLGGCQRKIGSSDFRGADLTAFMGGCDIDLRGATIASGEAIVNVLAVMGGVVLRVPDTWHVVVEVTPLMGGVDDKTRQTPGEQAPRLVVRGLVTMGGIELKN